MFSARLLNKEEPLPDRGKWQWEAQCGSVQLQCLLEPVQKDTASLFLKLKASATLLDGSQITPRSLTRNSQYLKRRHPSQHLQQGEKSGSTERSAPFPAAGGQNQQVALPHRRLPDGAAGGGAVTPRGEKRTAVTARGGRAGRPQGGGTTRLSPRRSAGAGRAPGGTGRIDCPRGSCLVTRSRRAARHRRTKALIFYGTDFRAYEAPLPRLPHQTWALFHEESPMNNYLLSHPPGIRLFNYTATFRRESDYPLTLQWLPGAGYLRGPALPLAEKDAWRRRGYGPVLYMQSHCDVPSDRDRYVRELMKYIQVGAAARGAVGAAPAWPSRSVNGVFVLVFSRDVSRNGKRADRGLDGKTNCVPSHSAARAAPRAGG